MKKTKHQKFIQGLVKRHPDGFGFLIPDEKDHPDVYIPRHSMEGIMSNDRVMVEVTPEKGGERFRGEIVRVVSRGLRKIVGHFARLNDRDGLVRDEGKNWGQDLRIPLEHSMNAKNGEIVAAEIVTYPESGEKFTGRIVEVIGNAEDPMNDIRRVVHGNNIPEHFPPEVEREAKAFGHVPDEKDIQGRRDLRGKNLVTIDGATAKDFDDAVLVETTGEGFRLYVAIADVSHYVRPGSAIDKEAYARGTSVYFPNFVIPMLPEVLSNGLCSLNPHVPRLCLVAEMQFDFTGVMTGSEFYEAVMESKARITYGKAQEVIDGAEVAELRHVKETILRCADLAKILMAKRFREGSLDLEIPETQLQIDGAGRPVDVIRSERLFAHRLIEELMLAANVAVGTFLSKRDVPALFRIHEPPKEMAIATLEKYLTVFGGRVRLGKEGKLQKRLTRALEEFEGKPEAQVLHILTLRSMSQAKYAKDNVGHFGLGFDFYTHFTSPIRRYPDLIVHRLLKNQIMPNSAYRLMPEEDLVTAGTWLSACEQRSVKAERQLMAIKKARFMHQFLGQEFDGLVSSVAKFGVFVLLRQYDIDGLVRMDDLSGRWEFDEDELALVAESSGFSIRVGDEMKVVVAAADVSTGQITFTPVQATSSRKLQFASGKENRFNEPKPEQRDDHPAHRPGRKEERPDSFALPPRGQSPRTDGEKSRGGREDGPRDRNENRRGRSGGRRGSDNDRRDRNDDRRGSKHQEKDSARTPQAEPSRKNASKRGKAADDRGGVRKARVSQRGGEGSPGPVPGGKARRKRRR